MKNTAERGDRVRVQCFSLCRSAATEIPRRLKMLEFTVGGREVIPGISQGVVGMATGELKQLKLEPHDAFGAVRRELIKTIPRQRFPADLELRIGKRLTSVGVNSRRRRRVKIIGINPDTVIVDANHPLAGRTLEMEVHLVSLDSFAAEHGELPRDVQDEG